MPFDPSYPPLNAEIESAPLRAQFTSLKALIDAVPGITDAVLDSVTTGNPGDPVSISLSFIGTVLHFAFTIPRGDTGAAGADGAPFANTVIDSVTTLPPTDPATVTTSFDGTNVRFTFGIPQGADGADGMTPLPVTSFVVDRVTTLPPGDPATVAAMFDGTSVRLTFGIPRGTPGTNGADGEVTNSALAAAIDGTSSNSNAVAFLSETAPPAYDQALMQVTLDKIDELLSVLRR